jgi:hypothetical protein
MLTPKLQHANMTLINKAGMQIALTQAAIIGMHLPTH